MEEENKTKLDPPFGNTRAVGGRGVLSPYCVFLRGSIQPNPFLPSLRDSNRKRREWTAEMQSVVILLAGLLENGLVTNISPEGFRENLIGGNLAKPQLPCGRMPTTNGHSPQPLHNRWLQQFLI